ncbi:MAG TPA: tetratricopeptide repeat protein [Ohtaekwangia sp.]|uniref:tetratricopeptide repeat protein n=1 Tax=Ohtaekwangia sp. TaxID=2066019 RepID=UPI002F92C83E
MNLYAVIKYTGLIFVAMAATHLSFGQETVFSIFKTSSSQADEYFRQEQYKKAIELYRALPQHDNEVCLQLARAYYRIHQPEEAGMWYRQALALEQPLPPTDMYQYAEILCTLKQYDQAIGWYQKYLKANPSDPIAIRKIWRLKNRAYLYEDSIHYTVKRMDINSPSGELAAVPYNRGIVFVSNRPQKGMILHARNNADPLYRVYYSKRVTDTLQGQISIRYETPARYCHELHAALQEGPVTFYGEHRMLYIASGISARKKGKQTLQLYFAELREGRWTITGSFPYNSTEYSITDAAITPDEKTLYFSSDMRGGAGGKDLYKSTFVNNQWTKPVNLGETINTSGDECFPFTDAGNTLYFASNGHPGLGGLDVFKAAVIPSGFGEVTNIGYPVNTNADDFGIYLDESGTHGFLTSNRLNNNDDVYELAIDLQNYPLVIAGILKYKEESWKDSTELKLFPHAQLLLIDNLRNISVGTASTDETGAFTLTIPYSSQYRIKVIDRQSGEEVFVGLELSKRKTTENRYEMVVVKNSFKRITNTLIK